MKQSFRILVVGLILIIFVWISISMASNGRDVFLNKCGSCHQENGDVKTFAPSKYASTQWRRFFRRNKHKRKKDISDLFNETEIKAVMEYLIRHAADSDQPEAVGLK